MAVATLTLDMTALAANWRALDRVSATGVQTAAVVKADGYGLGVEAVVKDSLGGSGSEGSNKGTPARSMMMM